MAVMSVSLLACCGGSDDSDSDKGTSITDENDSKQDEIETVTYDVIDKETGDIMKCEITYDAYNIYVVVDEENPVTSLSPESTQLFNHIGSGAGGSMYVLTDDSCTVSKRYEDAKEPS